MNRIRGDALFVYLDIFWYLLLGINNAGIAKHLVILPLLVIILVEIGKLITHYTDNDTAALYSTSMHITIADILNVTYKLY